MSKRLENLNNIVSVLRGGARFYRQSARQTQNTALEEVFLEHAELRENASRDLAAVIDDAGGEPADASTGEEARAAMAKIGTVFNDTADTLVNSLEEHEDRTLEVLREALHHPDNSRDEQMLRDLFSQFEKSHERMRAIKHADDTHEAASNA